jgi:phosphate transport system permease protein
VTAETAPRLPRLGGDAPPARPVPGTSPRRLLADRAARWAVTAGGMGIIASVLGILIFIVIEVAPLLLPAEVVAGAAFPIVPGSDPGALAGDEHRTHVAALGLDGVFRVYRASDGAVALEQAVLPGAAFVGATASPDGQVLAGVTSDGRLVAVPVRWSIRYEGQARVLEPLAPEPIVVEMDPAGQRPGAFAVRADGEGGLSAAAQLADGAVAIVRRTVREAFLTGEPTATVARSEVRFDRALAALALDRDGKNLYGGTEDGDVVFWAGPGEAAEIASAGPSPITALTLLKGDRSLVVGQADGSLSVWFSVRGPEGGFHLRRIRDFPAHPSSVRALAPSPRDKGFLAADASGRIGLHHSTSGRTPWAGDSPVGAPAAMTFCPKADGAWLLGGGRIAALDVRNPHPEVGARALFGEVWYEGYPAPAHVWQSSSGTDDFEPKLGLVPLVAGTLKGTFYSLVLAIPLGVFGAMYTSQFLHPRFQRVVRPTVEIMAALPSVVLGFLAGLWLAPRIERAFPALLLMIVVLPAGILAAGAGWRRLPAGLRGRFPAGAEALLYVGVLAGGIGLCLWSSDAFASLAFGGDFQAWLREATGLTYDQRNAVVVGLAMGFAVIPIIFAISEDAFSNVPRTLVSGSLALGATRWQTVTQVVLPTASPGVFSAIMVGFGRAVGETMIVLMATGNTPILDWSPFNGFRTLSANIAVEIPEAPVGGTLYRTLFLAALLLFVLTFLVNTAAEIVRQRLRRRYAEL